MGRPFSAVPREDTRPRVNAMQRVLKAAREAIAGYLSPGSGPLPVEHDRVAPRVLLLTSTLGSGHLRAAQAVEAALLKRSPTPTVQTIDFWSLMDAGVAQSVRQTYLRLVQERPELYDRIYQLDERTWRDILESNEAPPPALAEGLELLAATGADNARLEPSGGHYALDRVLFRLLCVVLPKRARRSWGNRALGRRALIKWGWARLARRLEARLQVFGPDVIIATQMGPAALLSFVKKRRRLNAPLIGVLTDFGVHDLWIQPGIDCYCVAHDSIAGLPGVAIERSRMSVTGIPLMPGFRNPPSVRQARLQLGLSPNAPVVLVPGGGLGLGVDAVAARLLACVARVQVLVLAGRNASVRRSLAPLVTRYPGRLSVWDWTEQTEVFIRAADVVVGKPGGLSVAEALACGRPLLATRSLRGQEGFNVRFLEQHGVGRLVPEDDLLAGIESLLANPGELARIQHRAWTLGKRDGASRIAELALTLAQSRSHSETVHTLMDWVRQITQSCLRRVDDLYRNRHRLQPAGEVLYVGRSRYRGPAMEFADGTRLAPGDLVGTLHFNNARFPQIEADTSRRAALRFLRLMLESMHILADRARQDPMFSDLAVYHAVSWLPPHGQRIGFTTEPFPDGPRKRLIAAYFRLLVWAYAPAEQTRASARPDPTIYWLTRKELLRQFGDVRDDVEERNGESPARVRAAT
jgi:processive 1,2-diacylglycerol beta-glucosyltransferase